jgi:hypothetical protein
MSPSAPKQPKRRERLLNRIQDVIKPKSCPLSPTRSTPDPTAGNNSPSPRPSTSPNLPAIPPAPAQTRDPTRVLSSPNTGPALSTATTASLATPAAPTAANEHSEAWSVARSGLETVLRILEKSADAFPPLKSAVSGLVACLDVIQASYDCRFTTEDYF